jgi:hypothetical protein
MKNYDLIKEMPVARFYYQGNHSHPVRRTILITEETPSVIIGYVLRDGANVYPFNKAPIKSFSKSKIARIKQCGRRLRTRTPKKSHSRSTYQRADLLNLVTKGV